MPRHPDATARRGEHPAARPGAAACAEAPGCPAAPPPAAPPPARSQHAATHRAVGLLPAHSQCITLTGGRDKTRGGCWRGKVVASKVVASKAVASKAVASKAVASKAVASKAVASKAVASSTTGRRSRPIVPSPHAAPGLFALAPRQRGEGGVEGPPLSLWRPPLTHPLPAGAGRGQKFRLGAASIT